MTVALIVALSVTVALAVATFFYAYTGRGATNSAGQGASAPQDRAVEEELRRTRDELRRAPSSSVSRRRWISTRS